MNDMNPVGWFEIYVQDMARAKAFYEGVFDVQLIELDGLDGEMWAFPMHAGRYGAAGALVRMPDGCPARQHPRLLQLRGLCLAAKAASAGGLVQREKFAIGQHGHIALVSDTEGA